MVNNIKIMQPISVELYKKIVDSSKKWESY